MLIILSFSLYTFDSLTSVSSANDVVNGCLHPSSISALSSFSESSTISVSRLSFKISNEMPKRRPGIPVTKYGNLHENPNMLRCVRQIPAAYRTRYVHNVQSFQFCSLNWPASRVYIVCAKEAQIVTLKDMPAVKPSTTFMSVSQPASSMITLASMVDCIKHHILSDLLSIISYLPETTQSPGRPQGVKLQLQHLALKQRTNLLSN